MAANWPSRTWNPAEKVTAGMMNSLRDQLNELHDQAGVKWQDIPYNAANFGATGGGTWTVTSGGVYANSGWLDPAMRIVYINCYVMGTASGTVNALRYTFPTMLAGVSISGNRRWILQPANYYDGAGWKAGVLEAGTNGTSVELKPMAGQSIVVGGIYAAFNFRYAVD